MNRSARVLILLILCTAPVPGWAQGAAPQRFENATAGIALTRPAGWHTQTLQALQENRQRMQLSDPELQAALQQVAAAPLFVFTKHPEPYPDLNPAIQVTLRPAGPFAGLAATDVMRIVAGGMQKVMADFSLAGEIQPAQVSGLPAAHMRARYTIRNTAGAEFKVLARMWLVPRDSFMLLIGMSGPQEGPDVSESEFAEVLRSVELQK